MKRFAWYCAAVALLLGACSEENEDAFGPVVRTGIEFTAEGLPASASSSFRVLVFNGVSFDKVLEKTVSDLNALSDEELPSGRYVWTAIAGYDSEAMLLLETENLSSCRLFLKTDAPGIPSLYYASRMVCVGEDERADLSFSPILSSVEVTGELPGEASRVQAVCAGVPRNFSLSSRSWDERVLTEVPLAVNLSGSDPATFTASGPVPPASAPKLTVTVTKEGKPYTMHHDLPALREGIAGTEKVEYTWDDFPGSGGFDIFLLIGQSNMAGRGTMLPGDETETLENVWLLDTEGVAVEAHNPLNQYSTVRKGASMQQINPGYAFSKKVAKETGRKILLVVNALGGSSIGMWKKTAGPVTDAASIAYGKLKLYDEAVRRTRQAMEFGELKAILWHQGEANSGDPEGYKSVLKQFVSDLRSDLGVPDVPFVCGELAYWRSSSAGFNEMIRTVSEFIPNSDCVSAEGAGMLKDETDPHFSREGQILLGERYADKVLRMCYSGK